MARQRKLNRNALCSRAKAQPRKMARGSKGGKPHRYPIVGVGGSVDGTLTVRRATPAARNAFNILPTDIGRRITELRPNLNFPDLENLLSDVIESLNMVERKVNDMGRPRVLAPRPDLSHVRQQN
jgi:PAS domain